MVDLERWPLVVALPPPERGEDALDLDEFYRELEQVLLRRRPFVVLFDVTGVKTLSSCRKRLVEWTNAHDSSIRAQMIALAVVVDSEVERAAVTAAFWNLNQSYHARIFNDAGEAEHWLLAEFARGHGAN